jgi:hypothetical protein
MALRSCGFKGGEPGHSRAATRREQLGDLGSLYGISIRLSSFVFLPHPCLSEAILVLPLSGLLLFSPSQSAALPVCDGQGTCRASCTVVKGWELQLRLWCQRQSRSRGLACSFIYLFICSVACRVWCWIIV